MPWAMADVRRRLDDLLVLAREVFAARQGPDSIVAETPGDAPTDSARRRDRSGAGGRPRGRADAATTFTNA